MSFENTFLCIFYVSSNFSIYFFQVLVDSQVLGNCLNLEKRGGLKDVEWKCVRESSNGEDIFANVHNLDHCVKYLNQSLVTFGFPSGLNLFSSDPVSIAKTCNCIYAMIQQRQRDIEYRETANDTRQRLETKMERLSDQLNIKEREMQTMASKEQKVTTAFKTQLEKLQLEKDEFQHMLIATQQVRSQQNHELEKKEKEYVKLQERLNQVLMEKKKETKNGIEIMNLLQILCDTSPSLSKW
ncbi:hypothetical protein M758_UG244300 [Ceratodon purpureus]|nr:hypothetical protein M758_UG244300 [Ceratodon purpureus]